MMEKMENNFFGYEVRNISRIQNWLEPWQVSEALWIVTAIAGIELKLSKAITFRRVCLCELYFYFHSLKNL